MINLNWVQNLVETFTFYGGGGKGGGGGDSSGTQTVTNTPWAGAAPYVTDYLSRGKAVTNQPYNFYNGDQVAGFAPEQEAGMNLNTQRALAGSPTLNAANNQVTNTMNGDYLSPDSNPYLKANVDQAMGDVQSRVNSQFNNNNFGGSAHQEVLQRGLGDVANNMYGQNYAQERNRQLQATTQAPTLANADYMDGQMLQSIGGQRQGLAQNYLNQASGQFNNANNFQYDQLGRYGDVVTRGMGGGGTQTSTGTMPDNQSSPIAGAIGGGATGYAIGSAIPALGASGGLWGAGAGALLGMFG